MAILKFILCLVVSYFILSLLLMIGVDVSCIMFR